MGGLEGRIGLPALQPVPCLSGSCVGGEGHGCLVYQIYFVYRELCHLAQYTCRSLVTFKPEPKLKFCKGQLFIGVGVCMRAILLKKL